MATYQSKYTGLEIDQAVELALSGALDSAIPIEVSTEADMIALLTSGEVGGIYKYTGTTGIYENGALYVLEEEATEDALAGTWMLNDTLNMAGSAQTYELSGSYLTYNNEQSYFLMPIARVLLNYFSDSPLTVEGESYFHSNRYYSNGNIRVYYYESGDEEYISANSSASNYTQLKTITITSKLSEVENGATLLAWLQANATKQGEVALGTFTLQYTGGDTSSKTCEFEIGMTWAEWIDSEYSNIGGDVPYLNSSNAVYRVGGNDRDQVKIDGVACYGDDLLINGGLYTSYYDDIYSGGSGN